MKNRSHGGLIECFGMGRHEGAPWTMNAWLIRIREEGWAKIRCDTYGILAYQVYTYPDEKSAREDLLHGQAKGPSLQDLAAHYGTSVRQIEMLLDDLRPKIGTDENFSIWRAQDNSIDVVLGPMCHKILRPRHSMVAVSFMSDTADEAGMRHMLVEAYEPPAAT